MNRPPAPPPGWYPDPTGAPRQRYWNGTEWAPLGAAQVSPPAPKKLVSLEKIILIPLAVMVVGLGVIFAIMGEWKALAGVVAMGVIIGGPIALLLLLVRRMRQSRQMRNEQREYREGLIARADQQHYGAGQFDSHQVSRPDLDPNGGHSRW